MHRTSTCGKRRLLPSARQVAPARRDLFLILYLTRALNPKSALATMADEATLMALLSKKNAMFGKIVFVT
jgi:hypothetical protein